MMFQPFLLPKEVFPDPPVPVLVTQIPEPSATAPLPTDPLPESPPETIITPKTEPREESEPR